MCQLDCLWVDERVKIRERYRAGDKKGIARSIGPALHIVQRSGLEYVEIKCQLDATGDFYCRSYCLLNMFRVPLCPSSGAREYYTSGCCLWYLVLWFSSCLRAAAAARKKDSVEIRRSVIMCEIIVHWLVTVRNNKRCTVQVLK